VSDVDAALARVLASAEYREPPADALAPFRAWLGERLRALVEWLDGIIELDAGVVGSAGETLLWASAILAAMLVVRALMRAPGRSAGHAGTAPGPSASAGGVERSLEAELAAAAAAAGAGAFLDAAHALYLAVLLWLDQAGELRYADAKTGADYTGELRGDRRGAFAALLGAFYPVAYGGRADAASAYAHMRRLASALGVPER